MRRNVIFTLLSLILLVLVVVACGAAPTPTALPSPTRTPRPTFTPAPSRTSTPQFSPTSTVTNTPLATATATAKPTDTVTPVPPTGTAVPPTNTPKPTNTPAPPPPPTNTPVPPPTPTPTKPFVPLLFGTEPNCGVTLVEGTVYDAGGAPKSGVVIWMSDASGNYRDGFTYSPDNSGATGAGKTAGWYSIVIQQPGMKAGKWFVVVVDSKAAVKAGSQKELSDRYFFDTDADGNACKPGGAGKQKWLVDFKANY